MLGEEIAEASVTWQQHSLRPRPPSVQPLQRRLSNPALPCPCRESVSSRMSAVSNCTDATRYCGRVQSDSYRSRGRAAGRMAKYCLIGCRSGQ